MDASLHTETGGSELDEIIAQCMRQVDQGLSVDQSRLLEEHPQHAAALREYFETADVFAHWFGRIPAGSSSVPAGSSSVPDDDRADENHADPARDADETECFDGDDSATSSVASPAPEFVADENQPIELGRYRLLEQLGQGAMGVVYLAEDTRLGRQVAIKFPKFDEANPDSTLARFEQEACTAARIHDSHICPVYDIGTIDGVHYISMAYIDGEPLSRRLRAGDLPTVDEAISITRAVASALAAAHAAGVIHRDLKPSNVMIDRRGEPVVTDFGLARMQDPANGAQLTQTGTSLGTPTYMAPEQIDPTWGTIGPATDIYALGVVLYEMLVGRPPFEGSATSVIGQIVTREPRPPSEICKEIPPRLEEICLRMMAKQPQNRPATMLDVTTTLVSMRTNQDADEADKTRFGSHDATLTEIPMNEIHPHEHPTEATGNRLGDQAASRQDSVSKGTTVVGNAPRPSHRPVRRPAVAGSRNGRMMVMAAAIVVMTGSLGTAWLLNDEKPNDQEPNQYAETVAATTNGNSNLGDDAGIGAGAAAANPLATGVLLHETFDGAKLPETLKYAFDTNFQSWSVENGRLVGRRILGGGPRYFSARSTNGFELDAQGLRYSAKIGRPPETIPGGSSVALLCGGYTVEFHPGYPVDPQQTEDRGKLALFKGDLADGKPLFQNADMGFVPALNALHTTEVDVRPEEKGVRIHIAVTGESREGKIRTYETEFLDDQSAIADGKIGVAIFGSNPPGTNGAFFDELQVERPAGR